ncbi:hypothetical protein ACFVJ5_01505 [Nocardia sp. NPDC127606]|uniref:hypothetical protein n=1 Tax=Nocardia sp. NPDC127606 TaxID=3345406 RepID=UPI003637AA5B
MGTIKDGDFLFNSELTAELKSSLSSTFSELQALVVAGTNHADVASGISDTSLAAACTAASTAVCDVAASLGLSVLSLSDNVGTVIEKLSALDLQRTTDTETLTEDLA